MRPLRHKLVADEARGESTWLRTGTGRRWSAAGSSLALILLSGLAVGAQALPRLTVTTTSHRTVTVSWPYTNYGFVLQEATNLVPNPPQVPFPPIDDNGNLITNNLPDQNQPLLRLASQMLPGRLVVQFNFLITSNAANPAVIAAAQNYGTLTAYQANNWYGSYGPAGSACGGTVRSPSPCDDASYLDLLQRGIYPLGPTHPLRSQYVEVWATNAITFTNAIWQAHQELFSPPLP